MQRQTQVSDGEVGTALLLIALAALLSIRLTRWVMDRYLRGAAPPAIVLLAFSAMPPTEATPWRMLAGALLFVRLSSGALDVPVNGNGPEEESKTGTLMGVVHARFSEAVLVSSLVSGVALDSGASPGSVLVGASLFLLVLAAGVATLRCDET